MNLALLSGLALAFSTLLCFGWLAAEVAAGGTARLDMAVRLEIHRHAFPALTMAVRVLTQLGSWWFLIGLGAVPVVMWVRQGRRRRLRLFFITMLGAELLEQTLKLLFERPRPEPFFGLVAPVGYSFPSGHALMSCCFYGFLAALAAREGRWYAWPAAAVLVAAIGLSRIYLGVHYPSDVVAGYAAAVVWVLTVRSVYLLNGGR